MSTTTEPNQPSSTTTDARRRRHSWPMKTRRTKASMKVPRKLIDRTQRQQAAMAEDLVRFKSIMREVRTATTPKKPRGGARAIASPRGRRRTTAAGQQSAVPSKPQNEGTQVVVTTQIPPEPSSSTSSIPHPPIEIFSNFSTPSTDHTASPSSVFYDPYQPVSSSFGLSRPMTLEPISADWINQGMPVHPGDQFLSATDHHMQQPPNSAPCCQCRCHFFDQNMVQYVDTSPMQHDLYVNEHQQSFSAPAMGAYEDPDADQEGSSMMPIRPSCYFQHPFQ